MNYPVGTEISWNKMWAAALTFLRMRRSSNHDTRRAKYNYSRLEQSGAAPAPGERSLQPERG